MCAKCALEDRFLVEFWLVGPIPCKKFKILIWDQFWPQVSTGNTSVFLEITLSRKLQMGPILTVINHNIFFIKTLFSLILDHVWWKLQKYCNYPRENESFCKTIYLSKHFPCSGLKQWKLSKIYFSNCSYRKQHRNSYLKSSLLPSVEIKRKF